jgi:hypothetical protein
MVERNGTNIGNPATVTLQPLEVMETRLAPMFMCCGHWSYSISFGISGPTLTVSWTEDGDAECNLL